MSAEIATDALRWADMLMQATFFIMQTYLTDVWKLSFTSAAAFLNIWGGISRILPIFFLFLADTILGNFLTLALSGILSTTGLVLITVTTWPGYGCQEKEEGTACGVGRREKVMFITGMAFIALGTAARSASTQPFLHDQTNQNQGSAPSRFCLALLFITPAIGFFVFPYVKKWYILFGVSAICTASATLFYLSCFNTYEKKGPRAEGSPITDFFRVFVAAVFKISQPVRDGDGDDDTQLHRVDGEEFQTLSSSRIMGFLHKAALIMPGDAAAVKKKSWRVCSVSEVESAKIMIRMGSVYSTYLMCGVAASTADTYLVEQANNLSTNIGHWKVPLQLFLLVFIFYKFLFAHVAHDEMVNDNDDDIDKNLVMGVFGTVFSVVYCAVAAAVERRRLHVVRGRDAKNPMSAAWLIFQVCVLGFVDACVRFGLSKFYEEEAPKSMERYEDCLSEGVTGVGFMCSAVLVYVVGKISEAGGGNNWFQHTLNTSRLDRYYWVLAALGSVSVIVSIFVVCSYRCKKTLTAPQLAIALG